MYANSEGAGDAVHMRRLASAFVARQCDEYQNLINWIKGWMNTFVFIFRQMVYPEKPLTKESWRLGRKQSRGKFRLGSRDASNYWQENLEQWEKEEDCSPENSPRQSPEKRSIPSYNGGSGKRTGSRYSESIDSTTNVVASGDFIHHPGFQGSEPAKLKVGKKTTKYSSKSDSVANSQSTFRPKGYGSLYDEMEFQRRYKKVFDVNNHIHFVHSNYLSGHKISKRSKLPPIGYVPGLQADNQENLDIFAIMSVQKYNHPEDEGASGITSVPGSHRSPRRDIEINGSIEVPPGFIPSPVKSYSNSPFNGIKGSPPHNMTPRGTNKYMYRLPSLSKDDPDSMFGQESSEDAGQSSGITPLSDRSFKGRKSKKSKLPDNNKSKKDSTKKKKVKDETENVITDDNDNLAEEMEPFTFSVKVKIKPRHPSSREGNNSDTENTKDIKVYVRNSGNPPREDTFPSPREDKIIYPSQDYDDRMEEIHSNHDERVLKPTNMSINTSEYGIVTKKVQYPEQFILDNLLAEVDESKVSVSEVTDHLQVPSTPDSNRAPTKGDNANERGDSNLSSGHSIPEIRTTCPTPENCTAKT